MAFQTRHKVDIPQACDVIIPSLRSQNVFRICRFSSYVEAQASTSFSPLA